MEDAERMLELETQQLPALFVVDGVGYEGHVESCTGGTVVAVARRLGSGPRQRYVWSYGQIDDFGRADVGPEPSEPEDPMMQTARVLVARAHEERGLSLAERLLRGKPTGGDDDDGGGRGAGG